MIAPPITVDELQSRAMHLAGLTVQEIAEQHQIQIPQDLHRHKGWLGDMMELILGANAGNKADVDFLELGIELKTLPINAHGHPAESTFVTSIEMSNIHNLDWQQSIVSKKLQHVLFIPIHCTHNSIIKNRIVATPFFWRPSESENKQLERDWIELMEYVQLGQLEQLDSRLGMYLQIRPKAAHARELTRSVNGSGEICKTLPRGFYLRSSFTRTIIETQYLK